MCRCYDSACICICVCIVVHGYTTSVLPHEERDTILIMLTIPNARHISWCFRSQFIFSGRNPQNLTAAATVENSNLWQRSPSSAPMAATQLSGCMVQSQPSTAWSDFNFSTPWSDPNFSTPWSELSCRDFFKIFQNLIPSPLGMTSSTLQPHFLSGVYYDNSDGHILCARA